MLSRRRLMMQAFSESASYDITTLNYDDVSAWRQGHYDATGNYTYDSTNSTSSGRICLTEKYINVPVKQTTYKFEYSGTNIKSYPVKMMLRTITNGEIVSYISVTSGSTFTIPEGITHVRINLYTDCYNTNRPLWADWSAFITGGNLQMKITEA